MAENKISPAMVILPVALVGAGLLTYNLTKAAPAAPPEGALMILEVDWYNETTATWHTFEEAMPSNVVLPFRFKISNGTNYSFSCKIGIYHEGLFPYWSYSDAFAIKPGEGYIYWEGWAGPAGTDIIIFRLFVNDVEVASIELTGTVV